MRTSVFLAFLLPGIALAQDVALPDATGVAAPAAVTNSADPAVPFTMTPPGEDANTLQVVQALQERRALLEARAGVEDARARLKTSTCEADRGCVSSAANPATIAPPPVGALRPADTAPRESDFTIAGIYKRAGAPATADLFVNGGRVSVEEGAPLPGGYTVASITTTGVAVVSARGKRRQLDFAQPVDVRGR
ncbi:type IV pilus biogenesis protein PilP [Sinimarinibacterium sp. CAU 1509]|uniref:type IV pilus biogenesis protein PilP n=1 Tax=Sinimarinibacterium sp. CAU 1509 TaxID=2562283 RepID=UPI00146AE0AF|nr:type IV pilus biogenesis protein PilP [Sinimarinibacterium sp. CAU 1509]